MILTVAAAAFAQVPVDLPELEDLPEDVALPTLPVCPDAAWPEGPWPDGTERMAAAAPDALAALDAYLFPPGLDARDPERAGVRTDGVVVVHRGQIVYERYRAPWSAEAPHASWSVSKSLLNALVGVAVKEGQLSVGDSICAHLEPGREVPEASCAVTVQNLLEMASGFRWLEAYEGGRPRASAVLAMHYGEGSADMAGFVARQPLVRPPGTAWQYSSGDSTLLTAVVGAALAPTHGERFPWEVLFEPLGITSATWERDAAGTYVGSSYLWATPRDLARFGFLALHDGCWNGEPVLPEGWIAWSTTVPEPIERQAIDMGRIVQARLFWVNRPLASQGPEDRWCPSAPPSMFAALGIRGQSITMVPEAELVIVRTADDRDDTYRHDETLRLALALVGR